MTPREQWLADQFEYEYCAECGGDAQHHTAVANFPFMGTFFARCAFPPSASTGWELHPVIQAFRAQGPQ